MVESYSNFLPRKRWGGVQITDKGQVTIPKHIRIAAGVRPGSEVVFSLEGGRIVITPVASGIRDDRRAALRRAAAKVRASLALEFRQLDADEIMSFLRGEEPETKPPRKAAAPVRRRS